MVGDDAKQRAGDMVLQNGLMHPCHDLDFFFLGVKWEATVLLEQKGDTT